MEKPNSLLFRVIVAWRNVRFDAKRHELPLTALLAIPTYLSRSGFYDI